MRKLLLPLLAIAALCAFGVSTASAKTTPRAAQAAASAKSLNKTIHGLGLGVAYAVNHNKINAGRIDTIVGQLSAVLNGVPAIVDGLTQLKAGLTALSAAVQGPTIGGQLGAAGTAAPGSANTATPSTLPTGTVYRQIVLSSAAFGPLPAGTPIGARTWVKNPDVTGLYANSYTCTGAGVSNEVATASGGAASVTCTGHTP
jgi:hypothetical protein